jgi:hypothetical protein
MRFYFSLSNGQKLNSILGFMNALCNKDPMNNLRLLQCDSFCAFIRIGEEIRDLLIDQYISSERQLEKMQREIRGRTFIEPQHNNLESLLLPTKVKSSQAGRHMTTYYQQQQQADTEQRNMHSSVGLPCQSANNSMIMCSYAAPKYQAGQSPEQAVYDFLKDLNMNQDVRQNTVK